MSEMLTRNRERSILAVPGAEFFDRDGEEMFQFIIDGGNIIGPRLATKTDKAQYPGEYAAFVQGKNVDLSQSDPERDGGVVDSDANSGRGEHGSTGSTAPGPRKPGRPRKRPVV